jgi:hypothetical protein
MHRASIFTSPPRYSSLALGLEHTEHEVHAHPRFVIVAIIVSAAMDTACLEVD